MPATRRQRAPNGAKPPLPPQSEATAWLAGRGLTTHGSHALQTSSNWSILKRPSRASVTNVVNLSQKTTIFNKKDVGLTTFVTTTQESTRKTPRIDDVCNKTRRATDQRPGPTGVEGTGGTGGSGRGAGGRRQGQGGPRDRPLRAAGSRVAITRAGRRPPAHTAARPRSRIRRRPEHP